MPTDAGLGAEGAQGGRAAGVALHDAPTVSSATVVAATTTQAPRPAWATRDGPADPALLLAHAERAVGERYRIERLAGQGGMGRVFEARDTRLGRRVAIKLLGVLDPHAGEDPGLVAHNRLVAEARAMARIDHPNLCRVIEVSLQHDTPFLVMDWADGEPLDRAWRDMDVRRRLGLFLKVVEAVAAAHDAGLVHGDLKPANIVVDRRDEPTIVDFGLARAEADPAWGPRVVGGTPGYAAPEQFSPDAFIGPAADVFALGVLLFELLTDRHPWPRGTSPAAMVEICRRGVPLPEDHAPQTPADLQKICLAALEAEPRDRYPDARALAADLRRYLRKETVAARPRRLAQRFEDQVQAQVDATRQWLRQGLVTSHEAERLLAALNDLQRAESPWVLDARRLRVSQVLLHLGGWLLVLGLAVGLARAWPALGGGWWLAAAWAAAGATAAGGVLLHRAGDARVGVGLLVTAQLALPAALWLTLRHTGWLVQGEGAGMGAALEWAGVLLGAASPPPGLANTQVLAVAWAATALALVLRKLTRSAAFTALGLAAMVAAWVGLYLVSGRLIRPGLNAAGEMGVWLAALGAASLPLGLALDADEQRMVRELGSRRVHRRDGPPLVWGAAGLVLIGLWLVAACAPSWWWRTPLVDVDGPRVETFAAALWATGALLAALMVVLARRATPLRRRVNAALRWVLPAHVLAPVAMLEANDGWGMWPLWIGLLPLASVGLCLAAAVRQWKPFLVSGLVCVALWYWRVLARLDEAADVPGSLHVLAALLAMGVGAGLMFAAWRSPAWVARARLSRWNRAVGGRVPSGGRSWRG